MKSTPTSPSSKRLGTSLFLLAAVALFAAACRDDDGPTAPDGSRTFLVQAVGDQFRMRLTDPEAIRLAMENLEGRNNKHPNGRIAPGDGGFNAPWSSLRFRQRSGWWMRRCRLRRDSALRRSHRAVTCLSVLPLVSPDRRLK